MACGYASFKDYTNWSVQSVASDLVRSGKTVTLVERYQGKKKKRGMGMDCIFVPEYQMYDKASMEKQKEKITCQQYDPHDPYLYQFSDAFAKYPFGQEYKNIGGDRNNYLDYFPISFVDEVAKVQYSYGEDEN